MDKNCLFCGNKLVKRINEDNWGFNTRKYCNKECYWKNKKLLPYSKKSVKAMATNNKGKKHTLERINKGREKIRKTVKKLWKNPEYKQKQSNVHKGKLGKLASNWQGGISNKNSKIRNSEQYAMWRLSVFSKDHYTCQKCKNVGQKLCAHHIENFATNLELRVVVSNGITLCSKCHKLFHIKYGYKNNLQQVLSFIK